MIWVNLNNDSSLINYMYNVHKTKNFLSVKLIQF